MHKLLLCLRSYQILFHVVMYIIQAVYTAIDTDKLMKEIYMLLYVIKATELNITNVMSLDNYLVSLN